MFALFVGCATGSDNQFDDDDDNDDGTASTSTDTGGDGAGTTTNTGGGDEGGSGGSGGVGNTGNTGGSGNTGNTGGQGGSGGSPPSTDGTLCTSVADLANVSFPFQLTGTFTDSSSAGSSCDSVSSNAVWYELTPSTTGWYDLALTNQTSTNAYSRVAVFETAACSPLGNEVACVSASDVTVDLLVELTGGTTYKVVFYTDGSSYTMVNPTLDLSQKVPASGDLCSMAEDVTAAQFPYQLSGGFEFDPEAAGSCDSTPTNGVWFKYTPTTSDLYDITVTNNTSTNAFSRLAIFDGASCSPLGSELACNTDSSKSAAAQVQLTSGQDYILVFYTDGDSYTMVNPVIDITVAPPPPPGSFCADALDISSESFPYQLSDSFEDDPSAGGSCDATPNNAVFYKFTPTVTQTYTILAENMTSTFAYSRLAIFTTAACTPYGAEITCETDLDQDVTASSVMLTAGTEYLLMFYTDGDSYTMVDPQITITTP